MGAREKVSLFVVFSMISLFFLSGMGADHICQASESQIVVEDVRTGDEILAKKGMISVRAICGNTWTDGQNYFYQYNVIVVNSGVEDVNDWDVEMTFLEQTMVETDLNRAASIRGKSVSIFPEEYHKRVMAGNQIKDIGVIVRSEHPLYSVKLLVK